MALRDKPAFGVLESATLAAGLLILIGCDGQSPAFQEIRSDQVEVLADNSADATISAEERPSEITSEGTAGSLNNENNQTDANDSNHQTNSTSANTPPDHYELFSMELEQEQKSRVDILWVVDSSGSMAEEQAYLGDKFNSFIGALAASDTDFQTAVTSTDICNQSIPSNLAEVVCPADYGGAGQHLRGDFVGTSGRQVLHSYDSDLVSKFNTYTNVGTDGSGFEHGLKGAELAIAKVLNGDNEPLIRSNSFLSIIVVSDEEDDGIGLGALDMYTNKNFADLGLTEFRYTHNNLISYLTTNIGAGKFSISTITGVRDKDGDMCQSPHSKPKEEGTQYIAAATATGGIVQSICDTDWDNSLYNIGQDISSQISQIVLERVPFAPSIEVYVEGEKQTKWSYIEGTNVIKFEPSAIPEAGSTIRIEFYAAP